MFKTTDRIYYSLLEVKKSKFYSFLIPFPFFESELNRLKKEHPKARHFVTAFRYLNQYNQIVEGCSDDGEPKGTSGKPTLKVLQGHNLIGVGVVTIRYFGGTLLGAGGLVRAYSDALNLTISTADLILYQDSLEEYITIPYNLTSKIEYLFKKFDIEVIERSFSDGISYKIRGNKENLLNLRKEIKI